MEDAGKSQVGFESDGAENVQSARATAISTFFKLVVAAGLIYWLVRADALKFSVLAKLATPMLLIFAAGSVFLQIFINNYRWLILLRGQGFETTIKRTMPLSLIGMFFNFMMPGGVGGDVVKGYYVLREHPEQKFAAAVSIFMDRMMGFFVMIGTAFIALFWNWSAVSHSPELQSVAYAVTLLFCGFLVFFFLSLSRLLQRSWLGRFLFETVPGGAKIRKIYDALHSYRRAPGALCGAIGLSLVNQGLLVSFMYVIGQVIGVTDIPLSVYFFLVPVGTVIQALPIAPAGIGIGQAAFFFLFKFYLGRETELGPTAITTLQIMNFFWGLFGAYFYLQRKNPASARQRTA